LQLEETAKELEAFSYSVSHDLRAPLRHISGFTDILMQDYVKDLPDKARHYLKNINEAALRMDALISGLLNYSRTGRAEMNKSSFKMNQVLEEALVEIKSLVTGRQITWNISGMPVVYGDPNLIRQVWVNLLDNAVKFTNTRQNTVITIGFKEEDEFLIFYVRDNGVGFDMNYSYKLFSVFQRLHSVTQYEGAGLGLANVRRIITRHGGKTWAEAEIDKGARFYFSLPKQVIL